MDYFSALLFAPSMVNQLAVVIASEALLQVGRSRQIE
jgi:hypothetical protein